MQLDFNMFLLAIVHTIGMGHETIKATNTLCIDQDYEWIDSVVCTHVCIYAHYV